MIITESCDLESATDFIARCFQADDLNRIRSLLVQTSVEERFLQLVTTKLRSLNTQSEDPAELDRLKKKVKEYSDKGFDIIWHHSENVPGIVPAIIRCPSSLVAADGLPIVTLEFFRTTKEGISFAKISLSVSLWCENISIAFEWINSLPNARQIWLNASHGVIHPKIPFYNGAVVCEDPEVLAKTTADFAGSVSQVFDNVQFITTFRANTFQTVVIPFGETFAN